MIDLLSGIAPSPTADPLAGISTPAPEQPKRRGRPRKSAAGANRPMYFDIETIPDESRLELFGLDSLPTLPPPTAGDELPSVESFLAMDLKAAAKFLSTNNPPDSWIDAVIAAEDAKEKPRKGLHDIIDDRTSRLNAIANAASERSKLLSTTPEFNRVISLAIAIGDDAPEALVDGIASRGSQVETEKSLLEFFWFTVRSCNTIVGFHIAGFDLPTIFIRSALLGIEPTRRIDLTPWKGEVVDLAVARFPKGSPGEEKTGRPGKMKTLARVYGIDVPAGDVDGSQVAELFKTDPAAVGRYDASDVVVAREIHRLYQGFFCA